MLCEGVNAASLVWQRLTAAAGQGAAPPQQAVRTPQEDEVAAASAAAAFRAALAPAALLERLLAAIGCAERTDTRTTAVWRFQRSMCHGWRTRAPPTHLRTDFLSFDLSRFDHTVLLDLALSDRGGVSLLSFLLRALKGALPCCGIFPTQTVLFSSAAGIRRIILMSGRPPPLWGCIFFPNSQTRSRNGRRRRRRAALLLREEGRRGNRRRQQAPPQRGCCCPRQRLFLVSLNFATLSRRPGGRGRCRSLRGRF